MMSERSQVSTLPQPELPLMSSAAASPAKTLAVPAQAKDWTVIDPASGGNTHDSLAKWDRDTSSWRTSQLCLSGEWSEFSETFPTSGMTRNGQLFRRAPWVRHTCDSECSLWPTPTASMDGRGFGIPMHNRSRRFKRSTTLRVQELVGEHGWRIHPNFTEALMDFPTGWTEIAD